MTLVVLWGGLAAAAAVILLASRYLARSADVIAVRTGLGREGNPLLENIVEESIFLPLKVAGALLCAFILWDINKRWPKLALTATSCFVALYSGIVLWNVAVFLIARA